MNSELYNIFVFGSNLAGRHGKGAAKHAKLYYGAKQGIGNGIQGNSYGIPTKDENLKVLSLTTIKKYVDDFIEYAKANPDKEFFVTKIGTGLAGYSNEQIAPMFKDCPANCELDSAWIKIIKKEIK